MTKIEFSPQEKTSHRIFFIITFATTCLILAYISEMKDHTLIHTDGQKEMLAFFFCFSFFTYFLICAILIECKVFICLPFVSLTGVLFVYMKHVYAYKTDLKNFLETLLIMEAIVHLIFVFVIFVYPNNNVQKSDIDTEEKKVGATKSVKNYASMADTEVLIENIVINV